MILPALAAGVLGALLALTTYTVSCVPMPGVSLCMGMKLWLGFSR